MKFPPINWSFAPSGSGAVADRGGRLTRKELAVVPPRGLAQLGLFSRLAIADLCGARFEGRALLRLKILEDIRNGWDTSGPSSVLVGCAKSRHANLLGVIR